MQLCGISKTNTEHKDFICSSLTWERHQKDSSRTRLFGKTMSFVFGAKTGHNPPYLQVHHTLSTRPRLIHTLYLQTCCQVCGTYLMGGRSDWVPSRSDDSESKSLDHLSRFKTEEARILLRLFST
jgi:hypothetical protein